jgi:hypothetical protein
MDHPAIGNDDRFGTAQRPPQQRISETAPDSVDGEVAVPMQDERLAAAKA